VAGIAGVRPDRHEKGLRALRRATSEKPKATKRQLEQVERVVFGAAALSSLVEREETKLKARRKHARRRKRRG
jgi:hypothetical protein